MSDLRLRDARPDDRDAIRAVTLAAYQEYATQLPAPHWDQYRQNILETLTDVAPAEQIVAEEGGTIVGAALLYPAQATAYGPHGGPVPMAAPEVRLLAVRPAARGRGIGRALMQECVRRARASGATAITLHTTAMMEAATRLYARMGFARAAELDFSPAPGLTIKGYRLTFDR
jgi:GNAT superfamily N-acetyltransferase